GYATRARNDGSHARLLTTTTDDNLPIPSHNTALQITPKDNQMATIKPHHPQALPFLFLTEMWERFGFYVVQGLLVLYMTQYFGFSDDDSYAIQGVFTALAYISPLAGGYLANKLLGFKTSIVWGGLLLVAGYALLALPFAKILLYPALATIIVGNGLFKPNVSSLLGMQYSKDDPRRDAGFTIFYIGINIGAFLAGLSSGYIKNYFGWQMSFGLASIGLIIGLLTFAYGRKYIKEAQVAPITTAAFKSKLFLYCLLAIVGINFLLRIHALASWLLPCVGIGLLGYLFLLTWQQNPEYKRKMLILNTLIISSIIFWALFLQLFLSANLFIDRLVDKTLFGLPLTTTVFYASESIFIILLGPLFAWTWHSLGDNDRNPPPISKFVLGIFFTGLGFLVLGFSTFFPDSNQLINPFWIFAAYLLITIGELLISPIGLAAVTILAPPQLVGLLMGVWFVATGFGGIFAGWIAKLSSVPDTVQTVGEKLAIYQTAFFDYAYLAFFVAILLFFVQLGLKKMLYSSEDR
ncbi:MAG: peptide MFS transporter, partial [Gammaproteobacteria bacterium]